MNCEHCVHIGVMAAKMKMMKLLQEIRGFAEVSNRRPHPRPLGLFLVEMRSHMTKVSTPNRKRNIVIEEQAFAEIPHPVKITHITPNPSNAEAVTAR
jgi:hypothetical protein